MAPPAKAITAAVLTFVIIWVIVCSVQYSRMSALVRDGIFPAYTMGYFWQIFVPTTLGVALLSGLLVGVIVVLVFRIKVG